METAIRNFRVQGTLRGLYAPNGGTPEEKFIENMKVELWHKGPMEIIYLGEGLTANDGSFAVEFQIESPTPVIEDGKINNVFLKVYYNGQIIIGDLDPSAGSFD